MIDTEKVGIRQMSAFFRTVDCKSNCYIFADGPDCFVIDPGSPDPAIITTIRELAPSARVSILVTHGHWDHFSGADFIISEFPGSVLYISAKDKPALFDPRLSYSFRSAGNYVLQAVDAVKTIAEGDHLKCGSIDVEVVETPGHTAGGVIFVVTDKKTIFTGDTLFKGNVGRTDLAGGDWKALIDSIEQKIFVYENDFQVFPGHYGATSVGDEKGE
jgi:glyoxylase-like metal-dependent hydrolase (beta-lactamase superfamily II)